MPAGKGERSNHRQLIVLDGAGDALRDFPKAGDGFLDLSASTTAPLTSADASPISRTVVLLIYLGAISILFEAV
ncbi:MAG: hypothetical protein MOB07_21985 [Acidobacteria bacterium]|nr:hypothetical protein [Acidobacteriota bacterium]